MCWCFSLHSSYHPKSHSTLYLMFYSNELNTMLQCFGLSIIVKYKLGANMVLEEVKWFTGVKNFEDHLFCNSKISQKGSFKGWKHHTVVLSSGTKHWTWKESMEKKDPQPYSGRIEILPDFSHRQQGCLPAPGTACWVRSLTEPIL